MLWVILGAGAVGAAAYVYVVRERLGVAGVGLMVLRSVAFLALLALLANAAVRRRPQAGSATVALDASLSMQTTDAAWARALDTAVALAGRGGLIVRFGDRTASFDSAPPSDGRSRVADALRVAAARGGPAIVVTDGELEDFASLPEELRESARLLLLPRASVPGLAVTEAALPERVLAGDSIRITVELTTWGGLADSSAGLAVRSGERTLLRREVTLPPSPGRGRRTVVLPPGTLSPGAHVLEIGVRAAGDAERRDDTRLRIIEVATLPAAVLVARPLDWEARFLARELADIVPGGVEAFGDLGDGHWVDLRTQRRVSAARVEATLRGATVVLTRGTVPGTERATRLWRWTGGGQVGLAGDWYVTPDVPTSALVPRLAGLGWDSLPPVYGVLPQEMRGWQAVLSARLGRRGAQRVVVAARDSGGRRELVSAAAGFWRWAFRGAGEREVYRTMVAAGVEWLLAGARPEAVAVLRAEPVVPRGVPVRFRWMGATPPEDAVALPLADGDSTVVHYVAFGADRTAALLLPPGVYRWVVRDPVRAQGTVAVEAYSPEFVPRPPVAHEARATVVQGARVGLRELWWGFGIVMLALLVEWALRLRRGLP